MHAWKAATLAGLVFWLAVLGQAEVALQIGQNFSAATLGVDSQLVPPDPNGVAGPDHYVEFINGRFSVYSKTNGNRLQTMTDSSFWSLAGLSIPTGWLISDPRIVYDPAIQRWFASEVDFDPSGVINTNRFLLAISAGADPTGLWRGLAIPADPAGLSFADFPRLGVDAAGVYLSGDMFDVAGTQVGSTLVSLPKSDLLANPPTAANRTEFGGLSYAVRGYLPQPAVCLDGSSSGEILATGSLGYDPATGELTTNTTLIMSTVLLAAGPDKATLTNRTAITVPPYTAPINPPQPDGTSSLDDGDARFSATIYAVGGILYAVQGTQVDDRAAIRWYRIKAANHTLLESGTITDTNLHFFYSSIAANPSGTIVIAFNGCGLSNYISAYAVAGQTVNGVTSFGTPVLLKAGSASYHDGFETIYQPSRWGDYSSTCVDPADPNRFWTIQMYPSAAAVWSTQVTELLTCYPTLSVAVAGTNATVSWPGTAVSFNLQSKTNLSVSNGWSLVSQTLTTNNGQVSAQVPLADGRKWFRLDKP
jgi:hypothetical protein